MPEFIQRPRQSGKTREFERACKRIGISPKGLLEVQVYSNGSVMAVYSDPRGFMGTRVVHWLRPPRPSYGQV